MAEPGVQKSAGAARKSEPLEATPETAAQYERSGLDQREATQISASLIRVMESDRLWKDSELTLADLAERIGTTPHKVSEVLNLQIGRTFYDFVNGYRVREVQRRIEAGETSTRKMLALAMDAGFASKSTFNQAFKKHTSQTPSGFRHAVGT
jgi:transcriptional regulator GlxA family with amidase domain